MASIYRRNWDTNTRRNSADIMISMLKFINEQGFALKTHILYNVNLNSRSLEKFLRKLMNANLVTTVRRDGREQFQVTIKGKLFLSYIDKAFTMLEGNSCAEAFQLKSSVRNMLKFKEKVKIKEGVVRHGKSGARHILNLVMEIPSKTGDIQEVYVSVLCGDVNLTDAVLSLGSVMAVSKDVGLPAVMIVPSRIRSQLSNLVAQIQAKNKVPNVVILGKEEWELLEDTLVRAIRFFE